MRRPGADGTARTGLGTGTPRERRWKGHVRVRRRGAHPYPGDPPDGRLLRFVPPASEASQSIAVSPTFVRRPAALAFAAATSAIRLRRSKAAKQLEPAVAPLCHAYPCSPRLALTQ